MFRFHKSERDKIFCGICGGIAERYNLDANVVRIVTAVVLIMIGAVIFKLLWIAFPDLISFFGGGLIGVAVYFIADKFIK